MMEKKTKKEKEDSLPLKMLRKTRSILISAAIDQKVAEKVISQIFLLEMQDPEKEIRIFINSPGGEVHSGMAIFDVLRFVSCPISTIVVGLAASMGSVISLAGDDGKRFSLPYARFLIHQPLLGGYVAPATDIEIQSREINKTKKIIGELYAQKTKKSLETILKDIDRDNWLSSTEALQYGLIDRILKNRKELPLFL